MTSASELFYNRRSRFGRSADVELGFDSSPDRISHHYNRRHRHTANNPRDRADLDGCDPPRRFSHPRHPLPRAAEHESVWFDRPRQSVSSNVSTSGNGNGARDRFRFSTNDRLPGAVLLARERLLQRLRGVSTPGNRHQSRSSIDQDNLVAEDDLRFADAGDWEIAFSSEWQTHTTRPVDFLRGQTSKRPGGLGQEALNRLLVEVFSNSDKCDGEKTSMASQECSICLESFLEGDKLIHLPCGHRFHRCCLDPWVRMCGCCPYCRKVITNS